MNQRFPNDIVVLQQSVEINKLIIKQAFLVCANEILEKYEQQLMHANCMYIINFKPFLGTIPQEWLKGVDIIDTYLFKM